MNTIELEKMVQKQAKAFFIENATDEQKTLIAFGMTDINILNDYMSIFKSYIVDSLKENRPEICLDMSDETILSSIKQEFLSKIEKSATLGFMSAVKMVV